jgi:flavin-dependent dehydrogenase
MDADVVVVGAGLAGLVAAAELADAGRRVIVVDQDPEANGQWGWIEDATGLPIAASIADALQRDLEGRRRACWFLGSVGPRVQRQRLTKDTVRQLFGLP